MRISDWSSDVCSSDLPELTDSVESSTGAPSEITIRILRSSGRASRRLCAHSSASPSIFSLSRSEEHTSELQSLMRISYAVLCLKKKKLNYRTLQNKSHPHTN